MSNQPVTIGRKVYFKPDPVNEPDLIFDATVCAVFNKGAHVNLSIHDSHGHQFARQGVVFVQPGDPVPAFPYAHWMPYQIAQASVANAAPPPAIAPVRVLTEADAAADLAGTARPEPTFIVPGLAVDPAISNVNNEAVSEVPASTSETSAPATEIGNSETATAESAS